MSDARFGWLARLFPVTGTLCCALWFVGSSAAASASSEVLQDETAETEVVETDGLDDSVEVRFNFKDQTWDEIIDFFSRSTGLPVVRETEVPQGTVTYIYPEPYPLPEALETLNILLQTQGVMVRRERDRLYLQKLSEMQRENIPTFVGKLPSEVTDDQVVTVLIPARERHAQHHRRATRQPRRQLWLGDRAATAECRDRRGNRRTDQAHPEDHR